MRQLDLFLDAEPETEALSESELSVPEYAMPQKEEETKATEEPVITTHPTLEEITETAAIPTLPTTLSPELLDSWENESPTASITNIEIEENKEKDEPGTSLEDSFPHVLDVVYFESMDLADGNEPLQVPKTLTSISRKVSVILPATENIIEDFKVSAKQLTKIIQPKKRGRKSIKQMEAEADAINVPIDEVLFQKQYYTMGEVCGMFNVNHSLLRYWEGEFDILQPRKNRKGDRLFRPDDIKNIETIYRLTRIKKYTIQGAKDYFKNQKLITKKFEIVQQLEHLRKFLLEIKAKM